MKELNPIKRYNVKNADGWTAVEKPSAGDRFTIAGHFRDRTFWEWITFKPKELQEFVLISSEEK
jgi:hypothetical protein